MSELNTRLGNGGNVKRGIPILVTLVLIIGMMLSPVSSAGQSGVKVTGGGTGTFGADLDGDGDIDGSQFGMGITLQGDGSAQGHFTCLMAGRSDFLGLALMAVTGKVSHGTLHGDGSATFGGVARVNLGHGQIVKGVPFQVHVTSGGPALGTLTLTVMGVFDGVPGDSLVGNGDYDLPLETVVSGQIVLH